MKRDMQTIRGLLVWMEEQDTPRLTHSRYVTWSPNTEER